MVIYADEVVRDEGTVVVFAGLDADGTARVFAADHRTAQVIADAIAANGEAACEVEGWQVLR